MLSGSLFSNDLFAEGFRFIHSLFLPSVHTLSTSLFLVRFLALYFIARVDFRSLSFATMRRLPVQMDYYFDEGGY